MAEFPNNQFSRDSNSEHMLRVNMCITGMAAHPEVEFRGDLVDKMTTHRDDIEALENQHADEWGDEQAATAFTNLCEDALTQKLSAARYMVQSMIEEEEIAPVKANDLRREFGVEASKPRDRDGMIALGKKMITTNARYVDEGSSYALPEDFFEDLETKTYALEAAISAHDVELNERLSVGAAKEAERDRGDVLLSNAFNWLCALYGEDAYILLDFGFVPTSQIVTPGQPEPGTPEWPGPASFEANYLGKKIVELVYGGVVGAVSGTIRRKDEEEDWAEIISGLPMDDENRVPFRDTKLDPGEYNYEFIPFNEANEEGIPSYSMVVVPE